MTENTTTVRFKTVSSKHRNTINPRKSRRGVVIVLAALLMVLLVFLLAFAIDIGYLGVVRTELQRSADCAALAGAGALYEPITEVEQYTYMPPAKVSEARFNAQAYGTANGAGPYIVSRSGKILSLDLNASNIPAGDIVLGRFAGSMQASLQNPNAVQVQLRMTNDSGNGNVQLFIGHMLGLDSVACSANAIAVVEDYPVLMPIATSLPHLRSSSVVDDFSYKDGQIVRESDGINELVIYPDTWDGTDLPPGNFGALQIGSDVGTTTLRRQIDQGPSMSDIAYHGGSLHEGIQIGGSTGIKADIETAFVGGSGDGMQYDGIIGKTRFMPIYSEVTGNGANAVFTIVRFVAVRIMEVSLKSGSKRVVVQPVFDPAMLRTSVRLCT